MLIAQITDLHIRMPGQKAYRVVETDRYLPPAVDALNRLDPAPTLAIVSGDLTDFGRPQEYAHLKHMLDGLRMPYFLMPGNHDAREELVAAFPDHAYLHGADGFVLEEIERLDDEALAYVRDRVLKERLAHWCAVRNAEVI